MTAFVSQILQGIMQGGLYALVAIGLSLSIGVVRIINLAHGDLVVLASYCILAIVTHFGLSPLVAFVLTVPIAAAGGYLLQRWMFQRIAGEKVLASLLLTFGISIVVQNGLLQVWGADTQRLAIGSFETVSVTIAPDIKLGALPLVTFVVAVAAIAGLDGLLYRTNLGARIRAVAENVESADLIGLSTVSINTITMAVIGATVALAALFVGIQVNFDPASGPTQLLTAFEAVILGGLGSLWGTLAGGIILGLAQTIGAQIDPTSQVLIGHLAFLVILLVRPQGIFTKREAT